MASRVDLHTHTTASDGTLPPLELFDKAAAIGVRILAVTDHDSTEGYRVIAAEQSRHPDIRLIPAIEMSAEGECACHLLGYFIRPDDTTFQNRLEGYRLKRIERIRAMANKLSTLGAPIDFDRVLELAQGGSVGRPHLADALREKGYVRSRQEAFDRFLKKHGPAYVATETPTAEETIRVIREAGGVPVLAHPSYYTSDELIEKLVGLGLMGIEAYYPEHSRSLIEHYKELASRWNLVLTGGSDFHGPRTGRSQLACAAVPEEAVSALEAARERI
jgi:predicted metal-dependent phosphoesterase TrpH